MWRWLIYVLLCYVAMHSVIISINSWIGVVWSWSVHNFYGKCHFCVYYVQNSNNRIVICNYIHIFKYSISTPVNKSCTISMEYKYDTHMIFFPLCSVMLSVSCNLDGLTPYRFRNNGLTTSMPFTDSAFKRLTFRRRKSTCPNLWLRIGCQDRLRWYNWIAFYFCHDCGEGEGSLLLGLSTTVCGRIKLPPTVFCCFLSSRLEF